MVRGHMRLVRSPVGLHYDANFPGDFSLTSRNLRVDSNGARKKVSVDWCSRTRRIELRRQRSGRRRSNGIEVPGAVRTTLGNLLLGVSYRYNPNSTLNLSVGVGVTRDTPDVSFTLRGPITF